MLAEMLQAVKVSPYPQYGSISVRPGAAFSPFYSYGNDHIRASTLASAFDNLDIFTLCLEKIVYFNVHIQKCHLYPLYSFQL